MAQDEGNTDGAPKDPFPIFAVGAILAALGYGLFLLVVSGFEVYLISEHLSPKKWMIIPLWLIPVLGFLVGTGGAVAGLVSAVRRKGSRIVPGVAVVLNVILLGLGVTNLILRVMLHR